MSDQSLCRALANGSRDPNSVCMNLDTAVHIELVLTDIGHGGVCVGRVPDGRVVFVRGGIPGERVRATVTESKKRLVKALVQEVIEPAEHRVPELWDDGAAGATGAADFQHIKLAWQRELKGQVLATQARRIGGEQFAEQLAQFSLVPNGIDLGMGSARHASSGADAHGWRTRTRFDVTKLRSGVGMYREHSHELLRLDEMPLAVSELNGLDLFNDAWDDALQCGARLHVVAPSVGEPVVVSDGAVWRAPGEQAASNKLVQRANAGDREYEYRIGSDSFWQVHRNAPSVLLQRVLAGAGLSGGERVLELFCGSGLFSAPIADRIGVQGKLLAIEGSEVAAVNAVANLRAYPWARARQGWIDAPGIAQAIREIEPSVVVADPPRAGLGLPAAHAIAGSPSVQRIVLVSCDPAAMARDAGAFVAVGFGVTNFEALDLFPHTHHVETLAVLERSEGTYR